MFFGAFFGLISAVAIYHLLMYAVLRVPEFLSYGAYLAALAIFQLGRYPQYLPVLGIAVDANGAVLVDVFRARALRLLAVPFVSHAAGVAAALGAGVLRADVRLRGGGAVRAVAPGRSTATA